MFRFTIRDVLWLMIVVGLAICFYTERASRMRLAAEKEQLRRAHVESQKQYGRLAELYARQRRSNARNNVAEQHEPAASNGITLP